MGMHLGERRHEELPSTIDARRTVRDLQILAADAHDPAVANDHGLILQDHLGVHGDHVDADERHDTGRSALGERDG